MNRHASSVALLVAALAAVPALAAHDWSSGSWEMRADDPGEVRLELRSGAGDHRSHWSSDVEIGAFTGLDLSTPGRHAAAFTLQRDAGTVTFEGEMQGDRGEGTYSFSPAPDYVARMSRLGFRVDEEDLFAYALHDVSLDFGRQMQQADIRGLDGDKLLAFRIHGVGSAYIDAIRAAGQPVDDSDTWIAFRIHGVSAEMIRGLRTSGYDPDDDELLALRIHGASPEWVNELAGRGYERLALDQLVAFRIHGVTPDFIGRIQGLGYDKPAADQLVAMRIHGVTPDYIRDLSDRGLTDLSIDKLIALRIHGID